MNRRLDIYLNGRSGLKELSIDLLLSWRHIPRLAAPAWRSLVDLLLDCLPLIVAIFGPLLALLSPIFAIWTAYIPLSEEEVRKRIREGIHKNGPIDLKSD